jgi:hypothetical protein
MIDLRYLIRDARSGIRDYGCWISGAHGVDDIFKAVGNATRIIKLEICKIHT